jgi:hypothetical protein
MRNLIRGAAASMCVLLGLAGCLSAGRGQGPLDSFVFSAGANQVLAENAVGAINERAEPKEIRVVVPAGTNLHALVATLSLNKEAVITVISSGARVVQQNGTTANDFSVPVTYALEVTGDKKPWTYKVFVRVADSNAQLSSLILPPGSFLRPAFNAAVHSYTLEVPFATTSVRVAGRGESPYLKSVSINGAVTPGAAGSAVVDFPSQQESLVTIETLAEDGATRARYTVNIQRGAPDSNASLDALDLQDVSLLPSFSPSQLGYQALVPFGTAQVVIHARPQSRVASVSLSAAQTVGGRGGSPQLSYRGDPTGRAGAVADLPPGPGLAIVVAVTAEDGTVQQYLLDVRRAPPDRNANLDTLEVQNVSLMPAFSPDQQRYQALVPFGTSQLVIRVRPQSRVASMSIGAAQTVGSAALTPLRMRGDPTSRAGAVADLPPGPGLAIVVAVTAEDGTAQQYLLDVRRAPPDRNSDLASLSVSSGALNPVFTPRMRAYRLALPSTVGNVTVTAIAASPVATITIVEQPGTVLSAGQGVTLAVAAGGSAVLTFMVRAEDGSQKPYRVQISRAPAPLDGNAFLQALQVTGAQVAPPFNPSVLQYDARIAANVESAVVAPVAQSKLASVAVDGQPAGSAGRTIAVPQGTTREVTIDVTAQNGTVVRYTLRVTRDAAGANPPGGERPGGGESPTTKPGEAQPGTGPLPPPPPDSGRDHVVVMAKNLKLGQSELAALKAAGDQVGAVAQISVRAYRTDELITRYSGPVEVRQQGPNITVSIAAPSRGVTLGRDRMVEVETAIATKAGHFLYYTEAQDADDRVTVDVPFLLYGDNPRVSWPALGSPVAVSGYLSQIPAAKERAVDNEDFDKNPKGQFAVAVEIVDAKSNASYGKDTVFSTPGPKRERALSFEKALQVPEGAVIRYTLTATAKNGKTWTAVGQAQVWTTLMAYPTGFEPVVLPVADDLVQGR